MAKLKIQKHKAVHPKFIDEALIRMADDLVLSILNCDKGHMKYPTQHMRQAIFNFSDYRTELLG